MSIDLLPELTVVHGGNKLSTCYQYAVQDDLGCKVLVVKFYDKFVDLISREATFPVGSRISMIMGTKLTKDAFQDRLRQSQRTGITRVEVSVCHAALTKYKALPRFNGGRWRDKVQAFLNHLISNVLNNKSITRCVYRKMSVPQLLTAFGDAK